MPYLEYRCQYGHTTEQFFTTITAGARCASIQCPVCKAPSEKVPSRPLGFAFYGDPAGYHNPSPTKRFSTKLVSSKEGNKNSAC